MVGLNSRSFIWCLYKMVKVVELNIAIGQFTYEMTDHVSWPRLSLVDHVMVLESQSKTTTETHQNTSFTIHPCLLHYIYDVTVDDVIKDDFIVTWLILDQSDHTEKPPLLNIQLAINQPISFQSLTPKRFCVGAQIHPIKSCQISSLGFSLPL